MVECIKKTCLLCWGSTRIYLVITSSKLLYCPWENRVMSIGFLKVYIKWDGVFCTWSNGFKSLELHANELYFYSSIHISIYLLQQLEMSRFIIILHIHIHIFHLFCLFIFLSIYIFTLTVIMGNIYLPSKNLNIHKIYQ